TEGLYQANQEGCKRSRRPNPPAPMSTSTCRSCGVGGSPGFSVVSSDGGVRGDRGGSCARRLVLPLPSHPMRANSKRTCICFIASPPSYDVKETARRSAAATVHLPAA